MANRDNDYRVTVQNLNGKTKDHRFTASSPREAAAMVRRHYGDYPIKIVSVQLADLRGKS